MLLVSSRNICGLVRATDLWHMTVQDSQRKSPIKSTGTYHPQRDQILLLQAKCHASVDGLFHINTKDLSRGPLCPDSKNLVPAALVILDFLFKQPAGPRFK
jgi:hypothetical protein